MKEHYRVFYEEGRFAGWPANHGIWIWGNEILVSFQDCEHSGKWEDHHTFVATSNRYKRFARSLDGGKTWTVEKPDMKFITDESAGPTDISDLTVFSGKLNFSAPGFCAFFTLSGIGGEHTSWWYYSEDKGHIWHGPYSMPNFGLPSITTRTDYHILNNDEMILFLTGTKSDGKEGRALCTKLLSDGCFEFLSYIGEEPEGFEIMPASLRRGDGTWVVQMRIKRPNKPKSLNLIGQYESSDLINWEYIFDVTEPRMDRTGNPPAVVAMKNGTWCLCYGSRVLPYGIRCRFSHDEGRSWGEEKIIRGDAACWDLGYVRLAENSDGKLVAVYYYNFEEAGERSIEATVFDEKL